MAQRSMELRSTEGEGPRLFLGRKKNRNKEQHCGEQHNGRTGGDIPVRGDEYSPDRAGDSDEDRIPGQRRETMRQLVGGGGRNQDHREDEDRADGLERYHHRESHQGQQEEKYASG